LVQSDLSPVVRHHPDDDFLVPGEDHAAPVTPRLSVAGAFSEIGRLATWKPTIFEAKLDQPPRKKRIHEIPAIIGVSDQSVH